MAKNVKGDEKIMKKIIITFISLLILTGCSSDAKITKINGSKAKELINRYFEQAQIDFDYAENGYEQDMILENVFAEAKRLLGKK